jgi:NAD(P)-dependent dehydrogenase (short-subunit alcohol dehydrogenase family)
MKTVVMTGGTSGLGEVAAQQILRTPNTRLLLGARGERRSSIDTLPLDLCSLASVQAFARAVSEELGNTQIDVLVLNAGTQFANLDQRTEDGFETTFGVNHLAHYLLLRLLLPKLAQGATVVITTSDTHDPKRIPMAPTQLDPEWLAHPQANGKKTGFSAGFRAYAASKLCNLLTARALAASAEAKTRGFTVIAFNPGLTLGTSLFRGWPLWVRWMMGVVKLVRPMARLGTVAQAGQALADLALGNITSPAGRIYASFVKRRVTWPDPSELAQRDDVMNELWRVSAEMVGLPERPLPAGLRVA